MSWGCAPWWLLGLENPWSQAEIAVNKGQFSVKHSLCRFGAGMGNIPGTSARLTWDGHSHSPAGLTRVRSAPGRAGLSSGQTVQGKVKLLPQEEVAGLGWGSCLFV